MKNQNKYYLIFLQNNCLMLLICIIITVYLILLFIKNNNYETFCTLIDNNNNNNYNYFKNNKNILISGNNFTYNSIYDNFYVSIYDFISFNENIYKEQGDIIFNLLEPYNLNIQKILLLDIMTGHLYGTIYNFPCLKISTNKNNSLCNYVKNNYNNININKFDIINDNINELNKFTCITNFSNNFYYYNDNELNMFFSKLNNMINTKGFLVINYIIDFNNIQMLYGSINKDKNLFFKNYKYKLISKPIENKIEIIETINPINKINKRQNTHIFYNHNVNKLIQISKLNNFDLMKNIYNSKYKENYGFLIFQKR